MDFEAMMKQAMFNMENDVYGKLFSNAIEQMGLDMDVNGYMQFQSIVAAFNKRGVSSRILFEVIMEVFGNGGGTNE